MGENVFLKHTKGNIEQANNQYQIKWRETEINSTKISEKFIHSLSLHLFNIVLEDLATAIRQLKVISVIQIGKE